MKLKQTVIAVVTGWLTCLLFPLSTHAQDAKESTIKYRKETHSGVIATYPEGADAVRAALLKRLAASGLTSKKTEKVFFVFRAVNWNEIIAAKTDVYVRVDGSSSKATAYIMIAKGYDNFISAATDPEAIDKLKNWLNALPADIEEYKKAQAVLAQQAAVAAAAADAKKAEQEAARAAKRQARADARHARKQEKLKEQQQKLSEMSGQ